MKILCVDIQRFQYGHKKFTDPASILFIDKNIRYICIKKYQKQIHPVQLRMYNMKNNTKIY